MKRSTAVISALSMLLAAPLSAQDTAAPKPTTQATPQPPTPESGIAPATPSSREKFASDVAFQSYALGMYFGPNNRYFFRGQEPDMEALKKGMASVFDGGKDFSYAVGASIALQIAHRDAKVDMDQLIAGLSDAFKYAEPKVSREDQRQAMSDLEAGLKKIRDAEIAAGAAANEAKGKAFLEENKKREGVKVTESGLQYEVVAEGKGDKPGADDTVMVNYKGTTVDGVVFDQTDAGNPKRLSLKSNYILPGWKEGMLMMSPGAKYKFYIPHEIGYGMEPRNNVIGGNEALVMEVELVSSEAPTQRPTPGVGSSAVTPPVRVPRPDNKATAVTPPVKVEIPANPGQEPKREVRVTPPVKVEFPQKPEQKDE
ncbi:MAG: FKBP-type peptidyl-prolyl cis-trans isomerase [Verrucomicrobia bacterium]|nr:FKBP-type peptidyl-prolyl cis-trans isomerase [Verrucomicrobiota bacterium]